MNQHAKLLVRIKNNPGDVRFEDACKAAESLGFKHVHGKGSHKTYQRAGEPIGLNFQNRKGKVPPYQAKQLIQMIDKYWDE
jgi:hypothetical protein